MTLSKSSVEFNKESNPFAKRSTLAYELPPFAEIRDEHYLPAFYAGMQVQLQEVEAILASGAPTFENTIVALLYKNLLNRRNC